MTKQGGFKRAVRQRARETGQRYSEARAAMDKNQSMVPVMRPLPFEHAALRAHLEERYEIRIASMASIAFPSWRIRPSTLRVKLEDGRRWVARIFSSPSDTASRVEGDAQILRFLASHTFPAERLADDESVSAFKGSGVIVTEFVEGHPTNDGVLESPTVSHELGSLLGRLHTLPAARGAMARDGGSFDDGRGSYLGRPKQDLAAAMNELVRVEDRIAPEGRETFEFLRDQVEQADDGEGLPEAFTHGNYHAWAAVGKPGSVVIVGWAGAGRAPRLATLAWLLRTSAKAGGDYVDAAVRGYRERVQLTDEEKNRLAGVLNMRPLLMACGDYALAVRNGHTPTLDTGGWISFRPEHGEQLATRVTAAFRG